MGEARSKRARLEKFVREHPHCCLCGGSRNTECIEHAPPRILFLNKRRPRSHEFPSCERCNFAFSPHDQIAAFAAMVMASAQKLDFPQGIIENLGQGIANNQPDALRCLGIEQSSDVWLVGEQHVIPGAEVPVDIELYHKWLNPWAAKQGIALYYHHTGEILSEDGRVITIWFSNCAISDGILPSDTWEKLKGVGQVRQGDWHEDGQFFYRWAIDAKNSLAAFALVLHESSVVLVFVSTGMDRRMKFYDGAVFRTSADTGIVAT